jgi:flagellar biosynthesis protein FlhB
MADDQSQDKSQKTEEPTQKKLEDARKKGQGVSSREVNNWLMIGAGAVVVIAMAPGIMSQLVRLLMPFLAQPDQIRVSVGSSGGDVGDFGLSLAGILAPAIAILIVAALATGILQRGFVVSAENMKPSLEKISILKGVKRIASLRSFVEFLKAVAKLIIVSAVATMVLLAERGILADLPTMAIADLLAVLERLLTKLLIGIAAIVSLIAGIDYLYQRMEFTKQMRMSRQDIKDELKQSEGDPYIKARLRQLRQERARTRMMAAVPEADVVITNPTHYACALKYEMDQMEAPILVAKGADEVAFRIRKVAKENDVPVIENPLLARALFAAVEIDEPIPVEHYKTVAEIIGYVMRLKGRLPRDPARA